MIQNDELDANNELDGEGANIDRRFVPYHAKCMRIQSHIEFIYLYIYIYASTVLLMRAALEFWP